MRIGDRHRGAAVPAEDDWADRGGAMASRCHILTADMAIARRHDRMRMDARIEPRLRSMGFPTGDSPHRGTTPNRSVRPESIGLESRRPVGELKSLSHSIGCGDLGALISFPGTGAVVPIIRAGLARLVAWIEFAARLLATAANSP